MLTCVEDSSHTQRSYSFPESAAPLTHRPRNTASIIESQTASTQAQRERRGGGGEGKAPASGLLLAIKNSIVLSSRILSSDVFAMKFNCEKSLSEAAVRLAGESWGL